MTYGEREQLPKAMQCRRCGFVACVCAFKAKHAATCAKRIAILDKPVECKPHRVRGCAECSPCTCGGDGR